jgi:hypothetical protein
MKQLQFEPMVQYQVHTTSDYFLFKSIDGNRNLNLLHLNRLKQSMSDNYLFTIMIVNENNEIIDGQHRFECCKDLNLPINYIKIPGYGLNEVHILNQNSKTWNCNDYCEGYINLGYKDYAVFKEFIDKYKIGHFEAMSLLSGSHIKTTAEFFNSGNFKVKSLKHAEDTMEKILMIEPYYVGIRRRSFLWAMMGLLKNENFYFTEFLQKLKIQPTALQDCNNITNYKILIEEIYNYRRKEKVNLRF